MGYCRVGLVIPVEVKVTKAHLLELVEYFVTENYTAFDGRLKIVNSYLEHWTSPVTEYVVNNMDSVNSSLDLIPIEYVRVDLGYNNGYLHRGLPESVVDSIKTDLEDACFLVDQLDVPNALALDLYLGAGFECENENENGLKVGWMFALKGDGRFENVVRLNNQLEERVPNLFMLREKMDEIFQCKTSFQRHYDY